MPNNSPGIRGLVVRARFTYDKKAQLHILQGDIATCCCYSNNLLMLLPSKLPNLNPNENALDVFSVKTCQTIHFGKAVTEARRRMVKVSLI